MAAQQYDTKVTKALQTPFYTEQRGNDTDTQQVTLLAHTWHGQHINMHQLFKPIGDGSAGTIKWEFCIALFPLLYLEAKNICTWYDWNLV